MKRKRLATVIAWLVCLVGIVDVLLRVYYVKFGNALMLGSNDPGKVIFHLVLLPSIAYILCTIWPVNLTISTYKRSPIILVFIGISLSFAFVALGISDFKDGMTNRLASPEDIGNKEIRKELVSLRLQFSGQSELSKNNLLQAYDSVLTAKFRKDYLKQASTRAYYSSFLTTLALGFAASFFMLLILYAIGVEKPEGKIKEAMLAIICLFSIWLPLRAYSEWYINFGNTTTYVPIYMAIIAIVVSSAIYMWIQKWRKVSVSLVTSVSIVSTLAPIISSIEPKWFNSMAVLFSNFYLLPMAVIYLMISIAVFAIVYSMLRQEPETKASKNSKLQMRDVNLEGSIPVKGGE